MFPSFVRSWLNYDVKTAKLWKEFVEEMKEVYRGRSHYDNDFYTIIGDEVFNIDAESMLRQFGFKASSPVCLPFQLNGYRVSTIFVAIAGNLESFETIVFYDEYRRAHAPVVFSTRYSTLDEARAGHRRIILSLRIMSLIGGVDNENFSF